MNFCVVINLWFVVPLICSIKGWNSILVKQRWAVSLSFNFMIFFVINPWFCYKLYSRIDLDYWKIKFLVTQNVSGLIVCKLIWNVLLFGDPLCEQFWWRKVWSNQVSIDSFQPPPSPRSFYLWGSIVFTAFMICHPTMKCVPTKYFKYTLHAIFLAIKCATFVVFLYFYF